MGSRAAQQALVPGRLILVTDATSGLQQLAVVCGKAPAQPRSLLAAKPAPSGGSPLRAVLDLYRHVTDVFGKWQRRKG